MNRHILLLFCMVFLPMGGKGADGKPADVSVNHEWFEFTDHFDTVFEGTMKYVPKTASSGEWVITVASLNGVALKETQEIRYPVFSSEMPPDPERDRKCTGFVETRGNAGNSRTWEVAPTFLRGLWEHNAGNVDFVQKALMAHYATQASNALKVMTCIISRMTDEAASLSLQSAFEQSYRDYLKWTCIRCDFNKVIRHDPDSVKWRRRFVLAAFVLLKQPWMEREEFRKLKESVESEVKWNSSVPVPLLETAFTGYGPCEAGRH